MTPTEQIDTKELRKLAEAATPGPWDYDTTETPYRIAGGEVVGGDCTGSGDLYTAYDDAVDENDNPAPRTLGENIAVANGRFMRAFDPTTILALLDRLERAEAAAGAPSGYISGDEVTKLAHALIREKLDDEDEDFHNARAHGIGSLNADILNFIKSRAAAPSAPVAAAHALVTPDMAGSPCSQCGRLGWHLCAASAAPVAAQAEPVAPCVQQMLQQGLAAPRTCPTCKLGPCRFERATPPAPMQEAGKDALIQKLQRALAFWLPSVPAEPKDVSERAGDDAMLLRGYDGKSERSAEELEWLRLDYTARYRHIRNLRVEQTNQPGQPGIAVPTTHNSGHFVTEEDADRVIDESIASTRAIATSKEEA